MINKNFGLIIKDLRKNRKLTQEELSEKSYISRRKLIDIEQGRANPSIEDLQFLSKVLKKDISSMYLEYQKFQGDYLKNLVDKIEFIISDMNHNLLKEPLKNLMEYKDINPHIKQYYYAFLGFYHMHSDELDIDLSIYYLNKALNIEINDFNINNFSDYNYSDFELRILLSLANCLRYKGYSKMHLNIIEFAYNNISGINLTYFIIMINYASLFTMKNEYRSSLKIIDKCIVNSCNSNILTYLPFLYYLSYLNHKELNNIDEVNHYYDKSLSLCDNFNKTNLKKLIIEKKEKY